MTPLYLQKLYFYEAYISYQDDPETLIYSIHKDAGFWRMLLSEANDLLSSMPGNDYYQHIKDNDYEELHKWSPGLHLIYNPGGKILMAIGAPDFERYISRTHDLAAYMNLVGLQFELSTHSSDPENAVANSKLQNPYTGDSMELDIDNRIISLDCLTNATTCSVSF